MSSVCCVLFLRDFGLTCRVSQRVSMMLGISAWCHQTTLAMLTCGMSSPLPTSVPPSPDPMGGPLRYPLSLASLPGEKAQAGTLLHPACYTSNQSINQYVFDVLGGNWDPTDKKFRSVNSYRQHLLPTCKAFPKEPPLHTLAQKCNVSHACLIWH